MCTKGTKKVTKISITTDANVCPAHVAHLFEVFKNENAVAVILESEENALERINGRELGDLIKYMDDVEHVFDVYGGLSESTNGLGLRASDREIFANLTNLYVGMRGSLIEMFLEAGMEREMKVVIAAGHALAYMEEKLVGARLMAKYLMGEPNLPIELPVNKVKLAARRDADGVMVIANSSDEDKIKYLISRVCTETREMLDGIVSSGKQIPFKLGDDISSMLAYIQDDLLEAYTKYVDDEEEQEEEQAPMSCPFAGHRPLTEEEAKVVISALVRPQQEQEAPVEEMATIMVFAGIPKKGLTRVPQDMDDFEPDLLFLGATNKTLPEFLDEDSVRLSKMNLGERVVFAV